MLQRIWNVDGLDGAGAAASRATLAGDKPQVGTGGGGREVRIRQVSDCGRTKGTRGLQIARRERGADKLERSFFSYHSRVAACFGSSGWVSGVVAGLGLENRVDGDSVTG